MPLKRGTKHTKSVFIPEGVFIPAKQVFIPEGVFIPAKQVFIPEGSSFPKGLHSRRVFIPEGSSFPKGLHSPKVSSFLRSRSSCRQRRHIMAYTHTALSLSQLFPKYKFLTHKLLHSMGTWLLTTMSILSSHLFLYYKHKPNW